MKIVLALLGAVLFGLPAALLGRGVAEAGQPDPDPAATVAVLYPGQAIAVEKDPFRADQAAWLRFMMDRRDGAPMAAPSPNAPLDTTTARARVEAEGWQTSDGPPDTYAFSATRGEVRLDVYSDFTTVHKQAAWWVIALTIVAGLAGAVLGAWLTLSARRLARHKTPRSRTVIRETAVVGVALLVPLLVQTALNLFGVVDLTLPYSAQLLVELARWPAVLGILLLAATLLTLRVADVKTPASRA
ncbi:hypothetical protein JIG36_03935 [Actinoplanes sp. LDG1-06]|uniref:Uncharacterized protein n=1 Tax=Paractinoplanes ovalisporus TaxID=2810368 RepID=A0ABS2A4E0_9ACTN|nr:hypothetical protein [Actinoplanes ovalisporus]MBM2614703.1 hypothetical protein [Actinoplanes ovalisporus]